MVLKILFFLIIMILIIISRRGKSLWNTKTWVVPVAVGARSVSKTTGHLKQLGIPDRKRTIPLYVFPHYFHTILLLCSLLN